MIITGTVLVPYVTFFVLFSSISYILLRYQFPLSQHNKSAAHKSKDNNKK